MWRLSVCKSLLVAYLPQVDTRQKLSVLAFKLFINICTVAASMALSNSSSSIACRSSFGSKRRYLLLSVPDIAAICSIVFFSSCIISPPCLIGYMQIASFFLASRDNTFYFMRTHQRIRDIPTLFVLSFRCPKRRFFESEHTCPVSPSLLPQKNKTAVRFSQRRLISTRGLYSRSRIVLLLRLSNIVCIVRFETALTSSLLVARRSASGNILRYASHSRGDSFNSCSIDFL